MQNWSACNTLLWDLTNLFSHLPCLLLLFTVPCNVVLTKPDKWETCPYHCSLHLFMMVRSSSFGPIACWVLAWTSLLITWSLYEICSILRYHLISMACLLLYSSAVRVHDSKAHWKMDVTRVRQSYLGTEKNAPVIPNWFQPCQRCYRLCYHAEYLRLGTVISYK